MRLPTSFLHLLCVAAACLAPHVVAAQQQTVCTITINSADEQKAFRRFLPENKYRFVELVERNRPDWLASACHAKVSCDVLIVSGHYGEGNEFFSDALEVRDALPIAELERVSCSDSCPSLFANLKEVYLFGCDTSSPRPQHSVSSEIARSFVREGTSPAEAAKLARLLGLERGESSRDRMRLVFKDVPVIYGFSARAPLGPAAAATLSRYFQRAGAGEIGKGRASSGLLRQFASNGLVATRGMRTGDPLTGMRQDVCTFASDQSSDAQKLASLHRILQRPAAQARMLLGRIERLTVALDPAARQDAGVDQALARIAGDARSRDRFLAFARDADEPQTRSRMIEVAHALGWLTRGERRDELAQMFGQLLARKTIAGTDVDLACKVNQSHELDGALDRLTLPAALTDDVGHSAILACLGRPEAHARAVKGLVSPSDADVRIAQTYLRQRPITDADELRAITTAIAAMSASEAQTRALDVLARHYLSDRESVATLERLFANTRSWPVQNAIAGVLIRADPKSIAGPDLLRTLREYRLQPSRGDNMVDALIQRLRLS